MLFYTFLYTIIFKLNVLQHTLVAFEKICHFVRCYQLSQSYRLSKYQTTARANSVVEKNYLFNCWGVEIPLFSWPAHCETGASLSLPYLPSPSISI